MKIKVKMANDGEFFIKRLESFSTNFRTEMLQATDTAGMTLIAGTRKVLNAQQFTPISEAWKRWKGEHGYDTRILFMTHQMYKQIDYKRMRSTMSIMSGQVGFRKSAMHHHWSSDKNYMNGNPISKGTRTRKGSARAKHKHSSVPTADLAKWLEGYMGDGAQGRNQIPRPFFKPTVDQFGPTLSRIYLMGFKRAWAG